MVEPTTCNSSFSPLCHFHLVPQLFHPSCATAERSWGQTCDSIYIPTEAQNCTSIMYH